MNRAKYELLEDVFSATTTFKKGTVVMGVPYNGHYHKNGCADIWLPDTETRIKEVDLKRLKFLEDISVPVSSSDSSYSYSNAQF